MPQRVRTTGVPDDFDIPGWVGDYVRVMGANRFPRSYHLLCGLLALGAVVGRRAVVHRSSFALYPPISILLLGTSGVGKSQSLRQAQRVVAAAVPSSRPGWFFSRGGFTARGLTKAWAEAQAASGVLLVEGLHIESELANIVTAKKGSETITTWLIQVLEHDVVEDFTGTYGRVRVEGMTMAFGFASTLEYLRRAVDADEFAGGFMHRFFTSYERDPVRARSERAPSGQEVAALASSLAELARGAPATLELTPAAEKRLNLIQAQEKWFSNLHLAGFWNRYDALVLRLAQLFTLSQGAASIGVKEIELATTLLSTYLYPPLEGIIEQVAATAQKKKLLDLADSLLSAGPDGWSAHTLVQKLGLGSQRAVQDALKLMEEEGLLFWRSTRVYGKKEWAADDEESEDLE